MPTERLTLDGRSVGTSADLVWWRTKPHQADLQGALQAPAQDIRGDIHSPVQMLPHGGGGHPTERSIGSGKSDDALKRSGFVYRYVLAGPAVPGKERSSPWFHVKPRRAVPHSLGVGGGCSRYAPLPGRCRQLVRRTPTSHRAPDLRRYEGIDTRCRNCIGEVKAMRSHVMPTVSRETQGGWCSSVQGRGGLSWRPS